MLLEVGRITRPHGVRGEVVVILTSNRAERVAPGAVLSTPQGSLTVSASRPHKGGWIVDFEEVADRDAADQLRGTVLSAEPIDDPDELWVHELVGATLIDQTGTARGTVIGIVENPASDLLELDTGALVPLTFLTGHEPGTTITVDVPDGLFDVEDGSP